MFQKLPLYFIYAIKVDLYPNPSNPDSALEVTVKVQRHQMNFRTEFW